MHFDNYRTAGNFLTWEHAFSSYGFSFIEFLYFRFFFTQQNETEKRRLQLQCTPVQNRL